MFGATRFRRAGTTADEAGPGAARADFVFRNGPIYTVSASAPWAQAVAVTGNTITYVGDEAGAMALAGPRPRSSISTAAC